MNKLLALLQTALAVAAALASVQAHAAPPDKADYSADRTRLTATYKVDMMACNARSGTAMDICIQEAKAKEAVARAELEYAYTGRSTDQNKILVAKAEGAYAVARKKCDNQAGGAKDACVDQAKASETKALAEAKASKQLAATADAAAAKRDADAAAAADKCAALAGNAKASCIAAAKAKFGPG